MAKTMNNEAAERLRVWISDAALLWPLPKNEQYVALREFDEALAAERRATVERLGERFDAEAVSEDTDLLYRWQIQRILDEEAAR